MMNRSLVCSAVLAVSVGLPAHAASYQISPFHLPGTTLVTLSGINDAGQLIGNYSIANDTTPFIDTGGAVTVIPSPISNPVYVSANGINNLGQVVVTAHQNQFGALVGSVFIYQNGAYLPNAGLSSQIAVQPLSSTEGTAIKDGGLIPGTGTTVGSQQSAQYALIGDITNLGDSRIVPLPTFTSSPHGSPMEGSLATITGIDNAGEFVGTYFSPVIGEQAYMDDLANNLRNLTIPGLSNVTPTAINNQGQIAGEAALGTQSVGFVLNADATYSLLTIPGTAYVDPTGINDAGEVVGTYSLVTPAGAAPDIESFVALPAPATAAAEPAYLPLAGFALLALLLRRFRPSTPGVGILMTGPAGGLTRSLTANRLGRASPGLSRTPGSTLARVVSFVVGIVAL